MNRKLCLRVLMAWLALVFCMGGAAQAAREGSVKAISPFEGHGLLFLVENNRAFMVGAWGGIMIIENGEGLLDATTLVCPGNMVANLSTGSRSGEGRCIITDQEGDKVYATWTCKGKSQDCRGPFNLTGGTGKFKGISGMSQFRVRVLMRGAAETGSSDTLQLISAGIALWPKLQYSIP